jgi:hypothetical protein
MKQEIHLPDTDITDNFDDRHNTNNLVHVNDDDIDDILLESTTVETDCIDFGSRALLHEDVPISEHYNRTTALCQKQRNSIKGKKIRVFKFVHDIKSTSLDDKSTS